MAEPPFPGGSIPAQLCSRRCLHSHSFPALSEQSGSTGNYCLEENKTKSPNYAGMTSRLIPAASSGNSAAAAAAIPPCPSRTQGTRTNIRVLSGHGDPKSSLHPQSRGFAGILKSSCSVPFFPHPGAAQSHSRLSPGWGFLWDGFFFPAHIPLCVFRAGIWDLVPQYRCLGLANGNAAGAQRGVKPWE